MAKGKEWNKIKRSYYLDPELARALAVEAAYQGRRQSTLVDEALRLYLKGVKRKGRKEG